MCSRSSSVIRLTSCVLFADHCRVLVSRRIQLFGQILLTAVAAGALLLAVDLGTVLDTIRRAHPFWLGAALLLLPVNLALDGWVWARLLNAADGQYSPRSVARALLCGFALGFWTPARLGEYAGRAYSFAEADRGSVTLSVLAQRALDMVVGVGVGLGALLWGAHAGLVPGSPSWQAAAAIGGGTLALFCAALLFPALLYRLAATVGNRLVPLAPDPRFFDRLGPREGLPALGGTVVRYIVFTGQFVCLALALQPSISVGLVSLAVALTFFAKYLLPSLTLLDLGLREGAAVFFFSVLGLPPAVALSAALLLFTLNVLLPALMGLPAVARLSVFPSPEASPASSPTS